MGLSKIDVAEAQIRMAVRLFFNDEHPVPIHTLACAAREILTTIGSKMKIDTVLHDVARIQGISFPEAIKKAHGFAKFFKHADHDTDAELEGFSDTDNDYVIWFACHDFYRVAGGAPIEVQVFEAWWFATTVPRVSQGGLKWQRKVKACIRVFPPGFRTVSRTVQKRMGGEVLRKASQNPAFRMQFKRTVDLPEKA